MDFGLSEEQELLQQSLRGYLGERVPLPRVREIIEGEAGWNETVLRGLAEQGVCGVLVPEAHGGSGLGLLDAALIAEELGRAVTPYSFHSHAVMAALALAGLGSSEQQRRWLPDLAAGRAHLAVAFLSTPEDDEAPLTGEAGFVACAPPADAYIVFRDKAGEVEAWVLPASSVGVRTTELAQVDLSRRLCALSLQGVDPGEAVPLRAGDAAQVRRRVLDAGRIVLAADALGAAERGLEAAVEYAQARRQFGRPIASFQAVKHMCAETFAELEPLRSLLWYAAFAWDEQREDAVEAAAALKAHAAEVATEAVVTCTQVFGGMGFTWECDMQLWFKRVSYDRQVLGGPAGLRAEAAAARFSAGNDAARTRP